MSSADEIRRAQRIIILKDRLRRVTDSIDRVVREIGATTETSSAYWERVNIRLRAEYRMAQEIMRGWATSEIQREYLGNLSAVIRDIKGRVIRPGILSTTRPSARATIPSSPSPRSSRRPSPRTPQASSPGRRR
jgi:hypothetical protein